MSSLLPSAFNQLGLSEEQLKILEHLGFEAPTSIQAQAIPLVMEGKNVIGCANTGTGKTAAFVLPLLEKMEKGPGLQALILAPTRELALQIDSELTRLSGGRKALSGAIIGGAAMGPQVAALRQRRSVIVATPGRLVDHLEQGTARLDSVKYLVLDEADRMLDMGFAPQLERILQKLRKDRQTLLFSATLNGDVASFAKRHMKDAVKVEVHHQGTTAPRIEQRAFAVKEDLKLAWLVALIDNEPGSILVFVRTRGRAEQFAKKLERLKIPVSRIHSDRTQGQRRTAMEGFRSGQFRVMVATDIAARGIDVKDIGLVVNVDLPQSPEDYIHRIGRTGRAAGSGVAVSMVSSGEQQMWTRIERLIKKQIKPVLIDGHNALLKAAQDKLSALPAAPAQKEDKGGRGRGHQQRNGRGGPRDGKKGGRSSQGGRFRGSSNRRP